MAGSRSSEGHAGGVPGAGREADLRSRIRARLAGSRPAAPERVRVPGGEGDLPALIRRLTPRRLVPAAVLVPLIDRPEGLSVLLTRRADHLKHHAGQISFPGGRLEAVDAGPREAALREAREEVGLAEERVEVVGYLDNYLTITGYCVTPVVSFVDPALDVVIDETEVAEAFEVPLAHLFDATNIHRRERRFLGYAIPVYEIPWERHNIWGATAGMLVAFRRRILDDEAA